MASSATLNPEQPDGAVLAGMGDLCAEAERLAVLVRHALGADALCAEARPRPRTARRR